MQASGIRSARVRRVHYALLFQATVQRSLFFAYQMQRKRGAAIICAMRMLTWIPSAPPLAYTRAATR